MSVFVQDADFTLHHGDCLEVLSAMPDGSADCCVTSPPYIDARAEVPEFNPGLWPALFEKLSRVVDGGMVWNVGRVWRGGVEQLWWTELIQAASFSGWQHWDTLVWAKPNANPIHGRVLANSHEYALLFGRDGIRFNEDALRRPHTESTRARFSRPWKEHRGVKDMTSRNRVTGRPPLNPLGARPRSYFEACVGGSKGNPHPTPMAAEVAERYVSVASWPGQTVLDPFMGSGTTALVARSLGRRSIGIELNAEYCALAAGRLGQQSLLTEIPPDVGGGREPAEAGVS